MKLVTLDQAKLRLRIDGIELNEDIEALIDGASVLILRHLGAAADEFLLDEDGEPIEAADVVVPADVQTAVLVMVGILFRDPDAANSKDWDAGNLPRPVTCLLMSRRKPPIA